MVKINKISSETHGYLQIMNDLAGMPKQLYCIGKLPERRVVSVAVVGSRHVTAYGAASTQAIVGELARKGVVIVSGLALGVDAIAHRSALDAGGTTIAVMAHGLDTFHPKTNRQLAIDMLAAKGAMISEYPEGTRPFQSNFVARNRIVSAISDAIVVIEANQRSGTLITASFAAEQGKVVCAVPGPITSPTSAGCNQLIRTGATLVRDASDILEELGLRDLIDNSQQTLRIVGDTEPEAIIITILSAGEYEGDDLLRKSKLSSADYNVAMSMLEIKGVIKPLGANRWALRS